jgi:hypothetical protein
MSTIADTLPLVLPDGPGLGVLLLLLPGLPGGLAPPCTSCSSADSRRRSLGVATEARGSTLMRLPAWVGAWVVHREGTARSAPQPNSRTVQVATQPSCPV